MRVTDAARVLGVSRQRVWQLVQEGRLVRLPDGTIDDVSIERWARLRAEPPRS